MRKFLYLLLTSFVFFGCAEEYKPNGVVPGEDDPIELIFADSIAGMGASVKLEFNEDDCRSISASYGDNNEIYYQIIIVDQGSSKNCLEEKIIPKFDGFKIKKNKEGFDAFATTDTIEMAAWHEDEYVFFMKVHKEYVSDAVLNCYFLKFM
ncbi:MAG: hypothetical protein JXL97_03935 [Bacteroidales bacterium]|nr:hypothetical protein [Bacteroidales bacterium]